MAFSWREGQVAVTKVSGGIYLEGIVKFDVLIRLANDLLIAKKKHNIIHLEFSSVIHSQLLLGYDSFYAGPYPNQREAGISINFSGPMVNHREILNLLDWALDNEATIKSTQSAFQFRRFGNDNSTKYSVSQAMIHKAHRSTSEIVAHILRKKIYRNELGKTPLEIEYFFQNDSVFFTKKYNSSEYTILALPALFHILGNLNDGHLVFVEPDKFYFLHSGSTSGPFKIDSMKPYDLIASCVHVPGFRRNKDGYSNGSMYFLTFALQFQRKALFIPDRELLISDFAIYENPIFNNSKTPKEKTEVSYTKIILFGALTLSGVLNVLLTYAVFYKKPPKWWS